ncbi:MAG: phage holin family protein [bacterium]
MKKLPGILGRYVLVWVVAVLSLLLATSLLPGFRLDTEHPRYWVAVLRLPLLFTALLILLRPLLLFLTLPLNSLTLGLPTLFFNSLIFYLSAQMEQGFVITNYGEALVGTLVMTVISASITGWLGLDEAYPFYQSVIYRLGRNYGPKPSLKPTRGLLILQVDGLSLPSLRKCLSQGRMPTISAMLARKSHRLFGWHCGVPSNTPAVQAGVFYGTRENVAGYRWFDRNEQQVRVVSTPEDLRSLEAMVAEDRVGLLDGGSCINTFLSGGAAKRLMTVSALGEAGSRRRQGERADFNLFFLSPNAYTQAVLAGVWDYFAGLILAVVGRLDKNRTRLKFSIKRVAQRAVANSFLRDLSFFWLKQDMVRGVPVIYSNFVGYDDVAHSTGPDTYEAQISLSAFDRKLRSLRRRARRQSPISYDIVLFSDHGQTPSMPFRILYGETIEQTLARMMGRTLATGADPGRASDPDRSYTAALLAELEEVGTDRLGWAGRRGRRALEAITEPSQGEPDPGMQGPVVCVSGSLAHIYFPGHAHPLHLEEIVALYPGLVEQLARHPGIGFVAASRRFGDAVAIGGDGIRNLITGQIGQGSDPLAPYRQPDRWAGELAQLLGYPDSGDLVINGAWLEDEQKVVVLEEQSSSHGGIGGAQTQPFVLLPAKWKVSPMDLESPEALHQVLARELAKIKS